MKKRKDFELMTLMLLAGMPRAQPGERETLTKTDRSNVTPLVFYCRVKEDRERQRKRLLEERKATVYSSVMLIQTENHVHVFYCYRYKDVCLNAVQEITFSHV